MRVELERAIGPGSRADLALPAGLPASVDTLELRDGGGEFAATRFAVARP